MIKSIQKILAWINSKILYGSLFASLILTTFFSGCKSKKSASGFNTVENKIDSLEFFNSKVKIYLLAETWGLVGSHEQTKIFSDLSLDSIKLFTSEAYYKKVADDSLILYAPQSTIPNQPETNVGKVKVQLIGLNTQAELMDYSTNYEKYGLKKISAMVK